MGDKCVVCGSYRIKIKTISYYRMPRNSSHRAVWREAFVLDEAKLKPFSIVCSCHFVNGDSRCGPLLVPALLTPVAIAEEDVLAPVLPTLVPIMGPSTTVVAIEGGPDLTTVNGRSTVGVESAQIDGFALVATGSEAVCSTMIEGLAEASPLFIPIEWQ